MICARNKDLKHHNTYRIKQLGTPVAHIKSYNNTSLAAQQKSSVAQGLMSQVLVAKNFEILLTANLWKEKGLTNGAKGRVCYIIYAKGRKPPDVPDFIIVQVYQYTGPSYLPDEPKCVPIVPITRHWFLNNKQCSRTMLPIRPAYAISIHCSQGASMDKVIVNLSKTEYANGLTYTAVSRCKKIEDLAFYPMRNLPRFRDLKKRAAFKARLEHDKLEKESDEKMSQKNFGHKKRKSNQRKRKLSQNKQKESETSHSKQVQKEKLPKLIP